MLFYYKYVPHSIEKLQEYIDHLFLEVWCKANGEYDIDKLHPELKEIVLDFYYSESEGGRLFNASIEQNYRIFAALSLDDRVKLSAWYRNNNDIEKLCGADIDCLPLTYKELKRIHKDLSTDLERFFKQLFTYTMHLKPVWSRIGEIADHYNEFTIKNDVDICPFCGIYPIKGQYHTKRDAYDHYLPKDIYPFNSINFKNLAPICHECNSSYKTVKDPLHNALQIRRKAFYPYSPDQPKIDIQMTIRNKDVSCMSPGDIDLQISSKVHAEETETWKDVFGIDERYKATCCSKHYGKGWYGQVYDEVKNIRAATGVEISIGEWLQKVIKAAEKEPLAETNFLKKPFLEACEKVGLFKVV